MATQQRNSAMEREIRTLEEVTRAAHLGAGFQLMLDLWQHIVFNMQRRSLMPIIRLKMEMVILTTDMPLPAGNHLKVENWFRTVDLCQEGSTESSQV